MNTRTIVTVMTAALLSVGLVPVSSAEDNDAAMPAGIEVITIYAKRPAPTIATACVNAVAAQADTAAAHQNGESNFNNEVLASDWSNVRNTRHAIKRCIEQAAGSSEAQI
jgi:hypothetical protein